MPHSDNLDQVTLTTRFVLHENAEIIYAAHHLEDGMWQFNSIESALADEDYKVVSLGEILALDPTLDTIITQLKPGYQAERNSRSDAQWRISLMMNDAGNDNNPAL